MLTGISVSSERPVEGEQLQRLFRQTSWASGRSIASIERMLSRTTVYVGAWRDDQLVGFARSVTDDTFRALIDDVVVDAALHGQGIGAGLVQHLLNRLRQVEEVFLGCSDDLVPFYEKLGFAPAKTPFLKRVGAVRAGEP